MSKIILGYPYSGALYGYISDQMSEEFAHTRTIGSHGYYTTLYGKNYKRYIDQALMFSLIYDEVFLTPADNHWPESPTTQDRGFHPELGLHANWDTYANLFSDTDGRVEYYLNDPQINNILNSAFNIPPNYQKMILSSILYELNLSRLHRCPIACSNGRKIIIERLIEIDRPAIHPTILSASKIEVVSNYMNVTGLLLAPTNLEHLIYIKPEPKVRDYAKSYLSMLDSFQVSPTQSNELALLELAKSAIETEKLSTLASGLMNWLSTFFRLTHAPVLSLLSKGGSLAAQSISENAKWYTFSGEIKKAESHAVLMRKIEALERKLSAENGSADAI